MVLWMKHSGPARCLEAFIGLVAGCSPRAALILGDAGTKVIYPGGYHHPPTELKGRNPVRTSGTHPQVTHAGVVMLDSEGVHLEAFIVKLRKIRAVWS